MAWADRGACLRGSGLPGSGPSKATTRGGLWGWEGCTSYTAPPPPKSLLTLPRLRALKRLENSLTLGGAGGRWPCTSFNQHRLWDSSLAPPPGARRLPQGPGAPRRARNHGGSRLNGARDPVRRLRHGRGGARVRVFAGPGSWRPLVATLSKRPGTGRPCHGASSCGTRNR